MKYLALTFDDGPNTSVTVEILDLLEQYHIPASFFLIGNHITEETIPVVKRAYAMGCEINNHTKSHPSMPELSKEEMLAEVEDVTCKVTAITGSPTRFFRPPYIAVNDAMYDVIDMPFICGIGCDDWDIKVSVEQRLTILREQLCDGAIVLLHDSDYNHATVEVLSVLIPEFLAQGYQFVTVSDLFRAKKITPTTEGKQIYSVIGV